MASPIDEDFAALAEDFDLLETWEDRYRHLLDLGKALPDIPESERVEAHKVRGCASQVWLVAEPQPDGTLKFRGDSDAHLVRGLVAVLLSLYSGRRPADILAFDAKDAVARLGLGEALSSQRVSGLASMIGRIRQAAQAAAGAS